MFAGNSSRTDTLTGVNYSRVVASSTVSLSEPNVPCGSLLCNLILLLKEEQFHRFFIEITQIEALHRLTYIAPSAVHAMQSGPSSSEMTLPCSSAKKKQKDKAEGEAHAEAVEAKQRKQHLVCSEKNRVRESIGHHTPVKSTEQTHNIGFLSDAQKEAVPKIEHIVRYLDEIKKRREQQTLLGLGLAGLLETEHLAQTQPSIHIRESLADLSYLQHREREVIYIQEVRERSTLYEFAAGSFYRPRSPIPLASRDEFKMAPELRAIPGPSSPLIDRESRHFREAREGGVGKKDLLPENTHPEGSPANKIDLTSFQFPKRHQIRGTGVACTKESNMPAKVEGAIGSLPDTTRTRLSPSSGLNGENAKRTTKFIIPTSKVLEAYGQPNLTAMKTDQESSTHRTTTRSGYESRVSFVDILQEKESSPAALLVRTLHQIEQGHRPPLGLTRRSSSVQVRPDNSPLDREEESDKDSIPCGSEEEYWSTDVNLDSSSSSSDDDELPTDAEAEVVLSRVAKNAIRGPPNVEGGMNRTRKWSHTRPPTCPSSKTFNDNRSSRSFERGASPQLAPAPPQWDCVEVLTDAYRTKVPVSHKALHKGSSGTPRLTAPDLSVTENACPRDALVGGLPMNSRVPSALGRTHSTPRHRAPTTSSISRERLRSLSLPSQSHSPRVPDQYPSSARAEQGSLAKTSRRPHSCNADKMDQTSSNKGYIPASPTLLRRFRMERAPGVWSQPSSGVALRNPYGYGPRAQQALAASLAITPRPVLTRVSSRSDRASSPLSVLNKAGTVSSSSPRPVGRSPTPDAVVQQQERQQCYNNECSLVCGAAEKSLMCFPEEIRRNVYVPQHTKFRPYVHRPSYSDPDPLPAPSTATTRRHSATSRSVSYSDKMYELSTMAIQKRCAAITSFVGDVCSPLRSLPQPSSRVLLDNTTR